LISRSYKRCAVSEIAIPRNPDIGLQPQMDQTMGLSIQFVNAKGWMSLFEPWRLWEFRLMDGNLPPG
jgi:hypothetical protein